MTKKLTGSVDMTVPQLTLNRSTAIPRLSGLPIIGVLPQLLRSDPFEYLKNIMLTHGELVALKFGPLTVYLVSNPEYFQHILRDNYANYEKPDMLYRVLRKVVGNGLATSSGDFWLRQRRMIQPHLHRKQLPLLYDEMVAGIGAVLDTWEPRVANGEVFDLDAEMSRITIEVISRTMFGTAVLSDAEIKTVAEMIKVLADYIGQNAYFGFLPDWVPFPGDKKFKDAHQTVREVVTHLIERCREQGDDASVLIKMLLNTVDEATDQSMTDQQLFDEIMTIFAAGFETTASVLTWLWTVIGQHPEVQTKLQAEIDAVVGTDIPRFEDVGQLVYSRKVFLELMRLYTVIPMLPRKSINDDTLGDYALPAHSFVLMFFHGVHHNPRLWDEPERFDPERFNAEEIAKRHSFAYLPFSGGPRKCPGDEFALLEGLLAVTMILQRYSIQILPGQDFSPRMSLALTPHKGVKGTIHLRAR